MGKFQCNFISYALKRTVDITVVVPTPTLTDGFTLEMDPGAPISHKPRHKYPVLYLLHGMGNNHATWTGYTNVEMYAEEQNIIVVMFSAENKSYINSPGINGMLQDKFFDFLHKELPDFVGGMFPALTEPEHTYIAGLSMGGYGTLVHGFSSPEQYRAMGVFSVGGSLPPQKDENGNDIPPGSPLAADGAGGKNPRGGPAVPQDVHCLRRGGPPLSQRGGASGEDEGPGRRCNLGVPSGICP